MTQRILGGEGLFHLTGCHLWQSEAKAGTEMEALGECCFLPCFSQNPGHRHRQGTMPRSHRSKEASLPLSFVLPKSGHYKHRCRNISVMWCMCVCLCMCVCVYVYANLYTIV